MQLCFFGISSLLDFYQMRIKLETIFIGFLLIYRWIKIILKSSFWNWGIFLYYAPLTNIKIMGLIYQYINIKHRMHKYLDTPSALKGKLNVWNQKLKVRENKSRKSRLVWISTMNCVCLFSSQFCFAIPISADISVWFHSVILSESPKLIFQTLKFRTSFHLLMMHPKQYA